MKPLDKIKLALNEAYDPWEGIKQSSVKSKGLEHISFNNYKDMSGNPWRWDTIKHDFIQGHLGKPDVTTKELKDLIGDDVRYSSKDEAFVYKYGFFYRHGNDERKIAESLKKGLEVKGFDVEIVNTEEHWNQWPKDSFWKVMFRVKRKV